MVARYEATEVPGGKWRIIKHTPNGLSFLAKSYRTRDAALAAMAKAETADQYASAASDVRKRARKRCECLGECGRGHRARCHLQDGETGKVPGGGTVALTVVALNHVLDDVRQENLRAYCQLCQAYHDAEAKGEPGLFGFDEVAP